MVWKMVKSLIGGAVSGGRTFADKINFSRELGRAYDFHAIAPLQRSFTELPGGEQYGYIISDGRKARDVYGIVPGYFHSCFPRRYDEERRSSYIPPVGTSNAWKNSLKIADSVPGGHIIVFLDPEDNIPESIKNLKSYGIDEERLFVFVDTNGNLQPVNIASGIISDSIIIEQLPKNMSWLGERISQYQQAHTASAQLTGDDFHTLVVGCADKRKNTMFDRLFPNELGFEHLRFPGGFARPKGISATTDPIFASYRGKNVILISHTACVAVKEVDKGVMGDPVIKDAIRLVKESCAPGCSHDVEDVTAASSVLSLNNINEHGIGNVATFQYDVETGFLLQTDNVTGKAYNDQITNFHYSGLENLAMRISEYNDAVKMAEETKQTVNLR